MFFCEQGGRPGYGSMTGNKYSNIGLNQHWRVCIGEMRETTRLYMEKTLTLNLFSAFVEEKREGGIMGLCRMEEK